MEHSLPRAQATAASSAAVDLESVYRAHAHRVARWAGRLAGPAFDVDDLVQDVFLTVNRHLGRAPVGDADQLHAWLYRITANEVRHQRRKQRWRRWLGGSAEEVTAGDASSEPLPDQILEQQQATERVYRALDGIPEKYRNVLILFALEGASGEEIAALNDLKIGTVWVWLHRARQKFVEQMDKLDRASKKGRAR